MRLPILQTLTWGTIAASIASALLLAGDGDQGLPLMAPLAEHSNRAHAGEPEGHSADRAAAGPRGNGHPAPTPRDARHGPPGPR